MNMKWWIPALAETTVADDIAVELNLREALQAGPLLGPSCFGLEGIGVLAFERTVTPILPSRCLRLR